MAGAMTKGVAVALVIGAASASAEPGPHPQELLSALLSQAAALTASLANVAENLGHVKASVVIQTRQTSFELVTETNTLLHNPPLASISQTAPGIRASEQFVPIVAPIALDLGALSTTAIGALQSGALIGSTGTTGTVDTSGLADRVVLTANGVEGLAQRHGSVAKALMLQNVAVNLGDIDGSVQMALHDTEAHAGQIATTAIGAMESGMLTASLTGNMGEVADRTALLVSQLVGP